MAISTRKQQQHSDKIALIPGIIQTVSDHDKEIKRHSKDLYGNGEPGMDEQIRKIWEWIDLQKAKETKRAQWWDKFQWVVIPIFVSGLLLFLGQAAYFWFAVVPDLMTLK